MGFKKMHSTQGGFVLNLFTGSISPQYNVVFDDMFSTVVSSTAADPKFCISLVTSRISQIQDVLYQEYYSYFYDQWLTSDEKCTCFVKVSVKIVGRVK